MKYKKQERRQTRHWTSKVSEAQWSPKASKIQVE